MADSLPLNHPAACLRGVAGALQRMGGTSGALYNIALTAAAGKHTACQSHDAAEAVQGSAHLHCLRVPPHAAS